MFSIVQIPDRYPHKCVSCHVGIEGTDREFWVDFGDDEAPPGDGPHYQTTYVCGACITALAVQVGFTTPTDTAEIRSTVSELEEALFDARVKADGLEQALDGLLRARFLDDPAAALSAPVAESAATGDEGEPASGGFLDAGEGAPAEPGVLQGLADLHAAPGLDGGFGIFGPDQPS